MSELPGFTKLTSTPTKLRDLEMEDTFLQNLQVMNGGSNNFNLEDSLLTFQRNVVNDGVSLGSKIEIGTLTAEDEDSSIRMQKSTNDVVVYETIIQPHQYFVEFNNPEEESEPITTSILPGGIGIQIYDYETEQSYGTQPVLLNEQGKIDAQYLPENPIGITKASDMNQASFWDADVVVPTGHTLTNEAGINASQITAGTLVAERIPSLPASKINEGTFALERIPDLTTSKISDIETSYAKLSEGKISDSVIPNLNASKITAGTFDVGRIPDLSSTYAELTNNKISENAIPDLSSTYASLTNSKISTSVIPNLGSSAGITIDASLITNTPWVSTVGDMVGDFWGEGIQTLYIPEYITVSTSQIMLRHVLDPSTAIELLVSIPNDIHSLFIKSSDGSSAGFDLQGVQVINQYHKAITHASDMNNSTFWNSNVDMGDKNLTTTGTVTASNIPSST